MARPKLPIHGWMNFYKPLGMTSTQAVSYIRYHTKAAKVGHGGTLDPLAEGVLPIAFGEATKTVNFTMEASKDYEFTVKFGTATNTDDAEGEVINTSKSRPSREQILDAIPGFVGKIMQAPPKFSAIKIDGKAAYALARGGDEVKMQPRPVWVESLELVDFNGEEATLKATTGKGVYIRSIARDLGKKLGCFGYVTMLKRTRVGNMTAENAVTEQKFEEKLAQMVDLGHDAQAFFSEHGLLVDLETMLDDIPAYYASYQEVRDVHFGTKLERIHLKPGITMKMMTPDGQLASIIKVGDDNMLNIIRNFNISD